MTNFTFLAITFHTVLMFSSVNQIKKIFIFLLFCLKLYSFEVYLETKPFATCGEWRMGLTTQILQKHFSSFLPLLHKTWDWPCNSANCMYLCTEYIHPLKEWMSLREFLSHIIFSNSVFSNPVFSNPAFSNFVLSNSIYSNYSLDTFLLVLFCQQKVTREQIVQLITTYSPILDGSWTKGEIYSCRKVKKKFWNSLLILIIL